MKHNLTILIISTMFIIAAAGSGMAEDMNHDMGHQMSMKKMDDGMAMEHSDHSGENIHNSIVDGYRFSYLLMDIRKKMSAMKAEGHMHEGMDATHHLMVYVKNPEGTAVENARVGYLVEGADGTTQKLMCMEMGGGFGSDVNLSNSGEYIIKTKVVTDGKKLIDEFAYSPE